MRLHVEGRVVVAQFAPNLPIVLHQHRLIKLALLPESERCWSSGLAQSSDGIEGRVAHG